MKEESLIDEYKETLNADGTRTVEIALYNSSIAPAVLDVFDSSGNIQVSGIKFIEGVKPGIKDWEDLLQTTGKGIKEPFTCGISGWEKCWNQFKTGKYGLERREISIRVKKGDLVRISHSSPTAFAYSSVSTMIDSIDLLGSAQKLSNPQEKIFSPNIQYSQILKRKMIEGFVKDEINKKYNWKKLGFELTKSSFKKNPLDLINSSIEVFRSIPDDLINSVKDGSGEAKVSGDALEIFVASLGGKASGIVNSAFAISQSANIYSRFLATQTAIKKPTAIVIAGFE